MLKKIDRISPTPQGHWVGDGFPVRSLFSVQGDGNDLSPFLLLDYAGPAEFPPTERPRGVGQHPHKGFETVTIVYQGELEHGDSAGNRGSIGPGDVQWMTAASGIIHEERHSSAFSKRGGTLEMVQLWVNLPAHDKKGPAAYQTLLDKDMPVVTLGDGLTRVRVIAGEFQGTRGPARTFTPIDVWDVRLQRTGIDLEFRPGFTTVLAVLRGTVSVNGKNEVGEAQVVVFDRDADQVRLDATAEATVLVLSGQPIDEPVVAYGPFVMNTHAEIRESIREFEGGRR